VKGTADRLVSALRKVRSWDRHVLRRVILRRLYQFRHGTAAPSFVRAIETERRIVELVADELNCLRSEVIDFDNEIGLRVLASSARVRTPTVYLKKRDIGDVNWNKLPNSFVLKPDWGEASLGVRVLRRENDAYHEALTNRNWSTAELMEAHYSLSGTGRVSASVSINERIGTGVGIPYDWKLYAFQGSVELILQIDRSSYPVRRRWYDDAWQPVKGVHAVNRSCESLPLPMHPDELIACAGRISRAVPIPFVRVDFYEDRAGVVLGEVTPLPGQRQWTHEWDLRLGKAWEKAEARVRMRNGYYK
jgi:hypothetical protein